MSRAGGSFGLSVAAPLVWRCPINLAKLRFHIPLVEPDEALVRNRPRFRLSIDATA